MARPLTKLRIHEVPSTSSFDEGVLALIVLNELLERAERREAEALRQRAMAATSEVSELCPTRTRRSLKPRTDSTRKALRDTNNRDEHLATGIDNLSDTQL
jgi:hypothetical protein